MSGSANGRSAATGSAATAPRTATQSRRSVRASGADAAPSKLHRSRLSHSTSSAGPPRTKTVAEPAANADVVIAAPRDAAVNTQSGRLSGTKSRASARTSAPAAATPSGKQRESRRSTTPANTRSAAPRPSGTLAQSAGEQNNTTGNALGHKPSRNHVLQTDDPVFVHMRRQRRSSSTGSAMSLSVCMSGSGHFELLAADKPVPEIPSGLEKELVRQYTENLLRLPLSEVERVVRAICPDPDFKLVMTHMKGEQLRLKNTAKHERSRSAPAGSAATGRSSATSSATLVAASTKGKTSKKTATSKRGKQVSAAPAPRPGWVKTPKVGETTAEASQRARSGRIAERASTPSLVTSRRRVVTNGMTPAAQEAALKRFSAAFSNEVRYVFLEDAGHLCNSRRIRFYHEQPAMVHTRNITIPDEALRPVYGQVVNKLLYRTLGWSEQECKPYTQAVTDIVIHQMNEQLAKAEPECNTV